MYKTFTKSKFTAFVSTVAATLLFTGTVFAGPPEDGKVRPGKPGPDNILDTALEISGMMDDSQGVPEFSYLVGAVGCLNEEEAAVIIGVLTGSDDYTLFAPVNDAFRNLQVALGVPVEETAPEKTCAVDMILDPGTLFAVLKYHVTEGRRFTNSVFNENNSKEIEMLAAGSIWSTPDTQLIDGFPQTITPVIANVKASNGVIHAIDTVMLPFNPFVEE
jgi:transforming growth factor-beta-induced protein